MAVWVVITTVIVALCALLWSTVNRSLARRSSLAPRTYWLVGVLGTLVPSMALIIYL